MTRLSDHFTVEEMACPTTGALKFQDGFIEKLERLRVAYGRPMVVTSACRTAEHNKSLIRRGYKASPNSFHLIGNPKYGTDTCAVDIQRPTGAELHELMQLALTTGWTVGFANTFIHLDRRADYTDMPAIVYDYQ